MLDSNVKLAVDIDGNMQKIHQVAEYLPESEMEEINRKIEELS
jgi:hypothetical protein